MLTIDTSHDNLGFSFFNVHMTIKMLHRVSSLHQAHLMFLHAIHKNIYNLLGFFLSNVICRYKNDMVPSKLAPPTIYP